MTLDEIRATLKTPAYDFLRNDEHLGSNVILLGLGGSYSYGTNNEGSDLDVRGCALNPASDILLGEDFGQVVDVPTDTTIYSFMKLVGLLLQVNPNTVELLGLKPEHYLVMTPIGEELLAHKKLFLSKKAVYSFGGYANQQLYRLNQKAAKEMHQAELEQHILKTMGHMQTDFGTKYTPVPEDGMRLYIDKAVQKGYDTEIFMDVRLTHYPLRDYVDMWSELKNMVRNYGKIGKRNEKAILHNKIGKHSMHLLRLYMMCLDILERGEIITYREKEHDLLMDIRNGKYLDESGKPIPEFFEMVDEYEKKLDYAAKHTELPDEPDAKEVREFVMSVNERVVRAKG